MDGVLVDSESSWEAIESEYLPDLFGKEITAKMGNLVGASLNGVIECALALGAVFDRVHVVKTYEEIAGRVYAQSPITEGVDNLVAKLIAKDFRIGVVTQSPHSWIDQVIPRLSFKDNIDLVISLHEHPKLKRKPEPDGYLEAFRFLDADPHHSFVLEDSNYGIQAGKAAGAFVIGYRGNLLPGYEQTGADAYADTMDDVIKLVKIPQP